VEFQLLFVPYYPFLKNKQGLFDFVFYTGIIGGIMGILTPQMNVMMAVFMFI